MCYLRKNRSNYVFIHWNGLTSTDVVRLTTRCFFWNIYRLFCTFFFVSMDQHRYAYKHAHIYECCRLKCVCGFMCMCVRVLRCMWVCLCSSACLFVKRRTRSRASLIQYSHLIVLRRNFRTNTEQTHIKAQRHAHTEHTQLLRLC